MNLCTSIYHYMNCLQNNKEYTGSGHTTEKRTNMTIISAYRKVNALIQCIDGHVCVILNDGDDAW